MKTVTDFKKLLHVGMKLHTTWHVKFNGRDEQGQPKWTDEDRGIREVSIKQTNSFALKTDKAGKSVDSWCSYPKATEAKIEGDKIIIMQEDSRYRDKTPVPLIPVLTYTIIS